MSDTQASVADRRRLERTSDSGRILTIALLLVLILAALVVLGIVLYRLPPNLDRDVWVCRGESGTLVLEFRNARGLLLGNVSQINDGKTLFEWHFAGTRERGNNLELNWGRGVVLNGTVDLRQGVLESRILFPDGTRHGAVFARMSADEVAGGYAPRKNPYRFTAPPAGSGWDVVDPPEVGIDTDSLEKTVRDFDRGEAGLIHSLIVVRRGRLVLEEYFHGFGRDDLHEIQSCTKSVVSLLVGIAVDQGKIASLDTPVFDYFPEHADLHTPEWDRVTLRHLLTMSAGLDWTNREAFSTRGTGRVFFRRVLSRRVAREPGSRGRYVGANVNLLAGVIHHATGMHADEFAARHLFEPLGIERWDWEGGKTDGYPTMAGTLKLRPLDMAKLGQLVLNQGEWAGQQVVSRQWIRESVTPQIAIGRDEDDYGYLWWRETMPFRGTSQELIIASGWGSQFIHAAPGLDAVVVNTGGNHHNGRTFDLGQVLVRRLLPGVE
jgi:CubicO group peptidase (beta-lactamase class C family)